MKREEAINILRKFPIGLMDLGSKEKQDITEAIDMALAALRGPTREQVEVCDDYCSFTERQGEQNG